MGPRRVTPGRATGEQRHDCRLGADVPAGQWRSGRVAGAIGRVPPGGPSSVDKPGTPWVVTGGDEVTGAVYASGSFQAIPIDDDGATDVAVKVLDSGVVVAAWVGGAPLGLWVSRT